MGYFFVKPIPHPELEANNHNRRHSAQYSRLATDGPVEDDEFPAANEAGTTSPPRSPRVNEYDYGDHSNPTKAPNPRRDHSRTRLLGEAEASVEDLSNSVELPPRSGHSRGISFARLNQNLSLPAVDISGRKLFRTLDFWLLTTIMFLRESLLFL
jgi:hypothetical protein